MLARGLDAGKRLTDHSSAETYKSRLPSGDQRGELSFRMPVVNGRCSVPSVLMIHKLERWRSFMISMKLRT
jgi:hypothetical protein